MYARIGRDHASTGRAFGYVFEDDIALHPSFAPAELGGVLHAAEQEALASGAEIMYLGGGRTYRKHGSWRVHVGRRPLGLSRCAVLCTHAYAVASAAAAGLYARISLALGSNFAPAMDQNLFRYATQAPRERWPLCVSMERRVQPPDCCRGVFYQARATYNSTIRSVQHVVQHAGPARGPGRRRVRQRGQRGQRGPRLRGESARTWTKGHFVHS